MRATINAYKRETGYTNRTLAKALNVSPNTVNGWMQESRMADWKKLAAIGCQRPEGL